MTGEAKKEEISTQSVAEVLIEEPIKEQDKKRSRARRNVAVNPLKEESSASAEQVVDEELVDEI